MKNITTILSSNSTLGYIFEENENTNLKRYMQANIYSRIIKNYYNNQGMEATEESNNRQMDKGDFVCMECMLEYYPAIKNEILPFEKIWVDLEGIMLGEMSDRERQIICYYLYVESKKTNKQTSKYSKRNRLTDKENKLVVISGEREVAGERQGQWVKKYKLLCIK